EATSLIEDGVERFVKELKKIILTFDGNIQFAETELFTREKLKVDRLVEQTYKNYISLSERVGVKEPLSIYALMAKMFAHIAKVVVDRYGEFGEKTIKRGVETFGNERGQHIARRAASVGKDNTLENYLTHYDMGRSELFEYETIYHENE